MPTNPVPTNPAPTNPAPTNPAPTNPAPTNPAPTNPAPPNPAPTEDPADTANVAGRPGGDRGPAGRRFGAAAVLTAVLLTVLTAAAAALAVLAWRWHSELDSEHAAAADRARAEQVAGDFAVAASTVDFNDLGAWLTSMQAAVSDDLSAQYDALAQPMRQILVPLRMRSTGTLVLTKVTSEAGGIYQVTAVVDVAATSLQAPQGTVTTTAYTVTLDRHADWQITAVGGPASNTPLPAGSTAVDPAAEGAGAGAPAIPGPTVPSTPGG